jgi:hypothetical protein
MCAGKINQSLMVLRNCLGILRENQKNNANTQVQTVLVQSSCTFYRNWIFLHHTFWGRCISDLSFLCPHIERSGANSFWPVRLFVCLSAKNFNIDHIFWMVCDREFVFHMLATPGICLIRGHLCFITHLVFFLWLLKFSPSHYLGEGYFWLVTRKIC